MIITNALIPVLFLLQSTPRPLIPWAQLFVNGNIREVFNLYLFRVDGNPARFDCRPDCDDEAKPSITPLTATFKESPRRSCP